MTEAELAVRAGNHTMKIAQRLLLHIMIETAADDRVGGVIEVMRTQARRLELAGYHGFAAALDIAWRIEKNQALPGDHQALSEWRANHF
jgi:hypothetical protein